MDLSELEEEARVGPLLMSSSLECMDWRAEAAALIDDMKNYVHKIQISNQHKSSDTRVYFDIETLERLPFVVSMDSCGFRICDETSKNQGASRPGPGQFRGDRKDVNEADTSGQAGALDEVKVYETINALLDHNSPKYRHAFAKALMDRIRSIE